MEIQSPYVKAIFNNILKQSSNIENEKTQSVSVKGYSIEIFAYVYTFFTFLYFRIRREFLEEEAELSGVISFQACNCINERK